jgi:predicted O-methyltransferase YrrM
MTISEDANPYLPDKVRPYWTANGIALRKFNLFCRNDPKIDTVLLPLYDGVSLIKWKSSASNGLSSE